MSRTDVLTVAVIISSTREGRFGDVPARWIADQVSSRADMKVDVIDLLKFSIPDVVAPSAMKPALPPDVAKLGRRLAGADAFVVVTPVYNRGYPAALKTAIDWFGEQWVAKPVGFVSYGGSGGGIYAVEQLRQVFTELHTATVSETVSFANYWEIFDDEGQPSNWDEAVPTATRLLDQLSWWARTLREGRDRQQYPLT